VNRVFGHIQNAISQVFYSNDAEMDQPKFNDLVTTVTEDQELWNEYCVAVKKRKIVTNLGCKEYLFIFIQENRVCIEEQYYFLKSNEDKNSQTPIINNNDAPNYFGNIKRRLSNSNKTSDNVCKVIMQSFSDETDCRKEDGVDHELKKIASANFVRQKKRSSGQRIKRFYQVDLLEPFPMRHDSSTH